MWWRHLTTQKQLIKSVLTTICTTYSLIKSPTSFAFLYCSINPIFSHSFIHSFFQFHIYWVLSQLLHFLLWPKIFKSFKNPRLSSPITFTTTTTTTILALVIKKWIIITRACQVTTTPPRTIIKEWRIRSRWISRYSTTGTTIALKMTNKKTKKWCRPMWSRGAE